MTTHELGNEDVLVTRIVESALDHRTPEVNATRPVPSLWLAGYPMQVMQVMQVMV